MAVDLITFLFGNLSIIIGMGISTIILLISIHFYSQTQNTGFILILIAQLMTIGWSFINLIVFQGVFLLQELDDQGYSLAEIFQITSFVGFLNISLSVFSSILLIIGLIIIGNSIKREIKSKDIYNL